MRAPNRWLLARYPLVVAAALVVVLLTAVLGVAHLVDGTFLRRVGVISFGQSAQPLAPAGARGAAGAPGLRSLLGIDPMEGAASFAEVKAPIDWQFPRDHGVHPSQRVEWWYLTGHLTRRAETGSLDKLRRFGFQVTFFRFGLAANSPARDSASVDRSHWRSDQIYMAHMAISDLSRDVHRSSERMSRDALGLASATAGDADVDVLGWRLRREPSSATGNERWTADIASEAGTLSLTLEPEKPIVFPGVKGYSVKGEAPGQASAYYSITRLRANGSLSLGEESMPVEGSAWLDREWSSGTMGPEQSGWDWLAVQFDDNTELMLYRIRRRNGATDPASAGLFVDAKGATIALDADDISWRPQRWWTAPSSGARYPVAWEISVARTGHQLHVEAAFDDQLMRHSVRYWEGAVRVAGQRNQHSATGHGYLELVGYEG